MRSVRLFLVALLLPMPLLVTFAQPQPPPKGPAAPLLLIRCDDIGMCHAVNTAARQVIAAGIPFSASVMVACPWFLEAVEILRDAPHISVGVHLTLNAEWKHYRWGPVSGAQAVPTLVDSLGYFFPSRKAFFDNRPCVDEVEVELRAQIERALRAGLRVDYVDYHMGTAVDTPELRRLVERLAQEYGLAISRYFGEIDVSGYYAAPAESKADSMLVKLSTLYPDSVNLLVCHIAVQTPESDALVDCNPTGLTDVGKHRQAELRTLLSAEFRRLLGTHHVQLVSYRDLVTREGLDAMRRPPQ